MTLYEYYHGAANPDETAELCRWNTKTEKESRVFRTRLFSNEGTSLRKAREDFKRIKNLNPNASAAFVFCGTKDNVTL